MLRNDPFEGRSATLRNMAGERIENSRKCESCGIVRYLYDSDGGFTVATAAFPRS
jgi:hypothetical protein